MSFVFARRSVKFNHADFIGFIHVGIVNPLKVIDFNGNFQMYLTLSCDVSYSTREVVAVKGQVKDKFDVRCLSHPGTCIVQPDGNRDASGGDALPLTIQSSSATTECVSRVTRGTAIAISM